MIQITGAYYRFTIRADSSAIFRNWTLLPVKGPGYPRKKPLKRYTSNLHYCKKFSKCAISITVRTDPGVTDNEIFYILG